LARLVPWCRDERAMRRGVALDTSCTSPSLETNAMRTTTPARVDRPIAIIAAIASLVGAIACSDIASPTAPQQIAPRANAAFSGYALASGKGDTTSTSSSKNH